MARYQPSGVAASQPKPISPAPGAARAVYAHSNRNRIGFWLFWVGLNAFFFLPFLFPTDDYLSTVANTWRYYVASYLCILIGAALEVRRLRLSFQPALKLWGAFFAAILVWMTIRSLLVGESFLSVFWNGIIYLSLMVMAILGQSGKAWKTLNGLFIAHTLIGSTYTLYTLAVSGAAQRTDLIMMAGYNILSGSGTNIPAALYAVPFLIYTFPVQPRLGKMAALLGYVATFSFFLVWQSRIGSALLVLQLLIFAFILWRGSRLHLFRISSVGRTLLIVGFIFIVLVSGSRIGEDLGTRIGDAVSLLSDRWLMRGSVLNTMLGDYRLYEASIFVQQLSWDEWLAGRGVAGTWQDGRAYGGELRTMVHIGYFHYILNGGILLLLLMLAPLAFGVRALLKGKDLRTMAAGGLWVQYSAGLVAYGFPSASLTWVLMGLALGKCVAKDQPPVTQPTPADLRRVDPSR